jgi:hypothetical protein
MSILRNGDEDLHYSDHSHRWIAPPEVDQAVWEADLRTHLSQHRTTMGGPPQVDEVSFCRPRRVPRPVTQLPKKVPARHNGVEVARPDLPRRVKDGSPRPLSGAA